MNDELRALSRDALVAHVLHLFGKTPDTQAIDTPDKLFEYFLMDVEMAPCMETSRVRNALSTVQLFVERCLMNLEPRVAPSTIDAAEWSWMKRYRVWEANRKVFLWPENWLEPELRDDASPFFKETMSELLQSDITEDAAAVALGNYLTKLEEVAKLEPCGIHYEEENDIAHVVARTPGAHRKYCYRRREGASWTPWEQIKLDIEDRPVVQTIWEGRRFLLWLRILKTTPLAAPSNLPTGSLTSVTGANVAAQVGTMRIQVQAVLCWSEYHNGKWQPTKTSDVNQPLELGLFPPTGSDAFDRSKLYLYVYEEREGEEVRLRVGVGGAGWKSFLLYNTHSLPVPDVWKDDPSAPQESRWFYTWTYNGSPSLWVSNGLGFDRGAYELHLLDGTVINSALQPTHRLQTPWDAPFFVENSRHVFYVTSTESPKTKSALRGFGILTASPGAASLQPLALSGRSTVAVLVGPGPSGLTPLGLGTSTSVRFAGQEIGPAGALPTGRTQQR